MEAKTYKQQYQHPLLMPLQEADALYFAVNTVCRSLSISLGLIHALLVISLKESSFGRSFGTCNR